MITVTKPTQQQLSENAKKMKASAEKFKERVKGGVFRKAAAMEGWPQGVDGIPDGWTVENL